MSTMSSSGPMSSSSSGNAPSSLPGTGIGGGTPMSTVFPLFLGNTGGDSVFNSITIILSF